MRDAVDVVKSFQAEIFMLIVLIFMFSAVLSVYNKSFEAMADDKNGLILYMSGATAVVVSGAEPNKVRASVDVVNKTCSDDPQFCEIIVMFLGGY